MANSPKRSRTQAQIAHQAARLIAEEGVTDFALAKRKAAKQLNLAENAPLPGNEEIEVALQDYRALYQPEHDHVILRQLRMEALAAMRLLEKFHPYLTGSVWRGTANQNSDINLLLFSDDAKSVLLFLLEQGIEFDDGEWKTRIGGREEIVPSYTLTGESNIQIHLAVLPENARYSGSRHPKTHADIAALQASLAAG